MPTFPHRLIIEPIVKNALLEDLGLAGDITTQALVPQHLTTRLALVARQSGTLAGLDAAFLAFALVDPLIRFERRAADGDRLTPGDQLAVIEGPAGAILTAERTALNLLSHLSGIASATRQLVDVVAGTGAQIVCTRKTTPGLRALEKYAVRAGGGSNHRFALHDAILIKDNHIAVVGSVREAIRLARQHAGHMVKIEIEVDRLDQLEEALGERPDAILLDNMDIPTLKEAVAMVGGRAITEASGRITVETVRDIASAGIDLISSGWITHSAPILDIGMDEV